MTFTDKQAKALKSKLAHQHVKLRASNGGTIAYVEGWHVIAEANRIFGFDCWDRCTLLPKCLWAELQQGQTTCFYSTRVRITVRAGESVIVREGIGTGSGRSTSAEAAHEIALKAAETDATKRALATFGNPFGLALYDKEQAGVTRPNAAAQKVRTASTSTANLSTIKPPLYDLFDPTNNKGKGLELAAFTIEALALIAKLGTIDDVYAFWEQNRKSLSAIRKAGEVGNRDPVEDIIAALKLRARALGAQNIGPDQSGADEKIRSTGMASLVKAPEPAALPLTKERRVRDKEHLAFVASQPCLICGRRPAHAHHLRFAQPRAMAMKVSDEFTVPLCAIHHDALHRTGDERAWWARNGILAPLKIAERLWNIPRQERQRWLQSGDGDQQAGADEVAHDMKGSSDQNGPVPSPPVNGCGESTRSRPGSSSTSDHRE